MVVRLHNLSKWEMLGAGKAIELLGDHPRRVRVEVNCEAPTRFDLVHGDEGLVTFICVAVGYEVMEFSAPGGSHVLATSDGEVWFFTNEGDQIASDREQVSFTRMMTRRTRSEQLERMMALQEMNFNRRLAAQAAETAELAAALEAAEARADDEVGGGDTDGAGQPDAGAPAEGAAPDTGQSEPAAP